MIWDKWAVAALAVVVASMTTILVMVPSSGPVLFVAFSGIAAAVVQSLRGPVGRPYVENRKPDSAPPTTRDVP